ncbi:hypothetical protein KEM48_001465 [Puccinia striiformis f. sp. tritici PST-130]|nr:hypothetical protein KEM48_001465 [Puccinia striiformis f. sp. tritici PST-130]
MNNRPPLNNPPDDPPHIRQRRTVSAAGQFNLDPVPPANFHVRPANTAARFNPDINPLDDIHRTDADIDRNAITIINSTKAQIRDRDCLLPDGSNYPTWQDFICERIRDAINRPNFSIPRITTLLLSVSPVPSSSTLFMNLCADT